MCWKLYVSVSNPSNNNGVTGSCVWDRLLCLTRFSGKIFSLAVRGMWQVHDMFLGAKLFPWYQLPCKWYALYIDDQV